MNHVYGHKLAVAILLFYIVSRRTPVYIMLKFCASKTQGTFHMQRGSKRRRHDGFSLITEDLSDTEFRRAFRLSLTTFNNLLLQLLSKLNHDALQAARSSRGVAEPAVRLPVTLRMLADGSYLDILMLFKLCLSTSGGTTPLLFPRIGTTMLTFEIWKSVRYEIV